jgi:hypothetical protein
MVLAKKRGNKRLRNFMFHLRNFHFIYAIIIAVLVLFCVYLYLLMQFKIGDVVYSVKNNKIGVVKAFSLFDLSYSIEWSDGEITQEKRKGIEKINKADISRLQPSNKTYDYRPYSYYKISSGEYKDYDYFSDSSSKGAISGIIYKGLFAISLEKKNCSSNYTCREWSNCSLNYNADFLSNNSINFGVQHKFCEDKNKCFPNIIDSRQCELGENISVERRFVCGYEQIELRDENGKLLARLNDKNKKGYLDVSINLIGEDEC